MSELSRGSARSLISFPLAVTFGYRPLYLTGAALILLSVVYPFISASGPASSDGLLGAGIIL